MLAALMHFCSDQSLHNLSGVDSLEATARLKIPAAD